MAHTDVLVLYDKQLAHKMLFPKKMYKVHYRNNLSSILSFRDQGNIIIPITVWTSNNLYSQGNFITFSNVKMAIIYVSLDEEINTTQLTRFYQRASKFTKVVHVVAHSNSEAEPDTGERKKKLLEWCVSSNTLDKNGTSYTDLSTTSEGIRQYILETLEMLEKSESS